MVSTFGHALTKVNPELVISPLLLRQKGLMNVVSRLDEATKNIRVICPSNGKIYVPLLYLEQFANRKSVARVTGMNSKVSDNRCRLTHHNMVRIFSTEKFPNCNVYISLDWLKALCLKKPQLFKFKFN